jgi:hypothetical protein
MDLSVYRCIEWFSLYEASFLVIDHKPLRPRKRPRRKGRAIRYAAHRVLEQLMLDATATPPRLAPIEEDGSIPEQEHDMHVSRDGLRAWCIEKKLRPQFLFPPSDALPKKAKVHGNVEHNARKREQVLGTALCVLAKWPDLCRGKRGKVTGDKLAEMLAEKAPLFWAETGEPPLSEKVIAGLLRKYLNALDHSPGPE